MSPEQCEGRLGHRRPQRHLRAGRDLLRDARRARRRSGETRPRCSRTTAAGARRRCRGGWRSAVALEDADHALPGQGSRAAAREHRRAAPGAAGGDRRRAGATRRRRRRRRRDGPAGCGPADAKAAAKPAAPAARATRGRAAVLREQEQRGRRARGDDAASARSWRTRPARSTCWPSVTRSGDNPTRAAASAGRDDRRARARQQRAGRPRARSRSRRAPTARAAIRARSSPRRSSTRASPIPTASCSRRRRWRCCPIFRSSRCRGGRGPRAYRRRPAGRRADDHADGRGAAGGPRRAPAHAARVGARGGERRRRRRSSRCSARRATARPTWRRCWCSTSRSLPAFQTLFVRAKEVLGGVEEQTTRELLARDAGAARRGARRISAARCSPSGWAPRWPRRSGPASPSSMGWAPPEHPELRALTAAPGAMRSARRARRRRGAARQGSRNGPLAVVVEDAHFVDETALDALEYAALSGGGLPDLDLRRRSPLLRARAHGLGGRAPRPAERSRCRARACGGRRAGAPTALARRERPGDRAGAAGRADGGDSRCCSSSSCAASSATAWCASRARGRAGPWPPTSSIACPICRSCSGWPAARPSRCRPI